MNDKKKRLEELERKLNTEKVTYTVTWGKAEDPEPPAEGVIVLKWPEDDKPRTFTT